MHCDFCFPFTSLLYNLCCIKDNRNNLYLTDTKYYIIFVKKMSNRFMQCHKVRIDLLQVVIMKIYSTMS